LNLVQGQEGQVHFSDVQKPTGDPRRSISPHQSGPPRGAPLPSRQRPLDTLEIRSELDIEEPAIDQRGHPHGGSSASACQGEHPHVGQANLLPAVARMKPAA
jgi:hypothetical protein